MNHQKPFDGAESVIRYLRKYTHRIAISNYRIKDMLDHVKEEQVVFEKEYMIKEPDFSNEPYTVEKSEEEEGLYIVEGPRIERMLGYTNLDSEKGFEFFQKFLKTNGILDELEKLGIEEGDTVKMYGWQFEFMR